MKALTKNNEWVEVKMIVPIVNRRNTSQTIGYLVEYQGKQHEVKIDRLK